MMDRYQDVQIRLPWSVICRLACKALINGLSFNSLIEKAVQDYVIKEGKNK